MYLIGKALETYLSRYVFGIRPVVVEIATLPQVGYWRLSALIEWEHSMAASTRPNVARSSGLPR